jgi:geranylgeranyl pyrophosphate synthase
MDSSQQVREIFSVYIDTIDTSLLEVFNEHLDFPLYKQLGYFMGFFDESLQPISCYGGKRFRSSLCLMLADWYGKKEAGVSVATSIELFHNFTLIHDDIIDGDTLRRGRPTVWKLFGTDHAINSGDGQLILAIQSVTDSSALTSDQKVAVHSFLTQQYLKVVEGQYLDFELTKAKLGDSKVNREAYLTMVGRKTADLIAASTKAAGLVAGKNEEETSALFEYGYNLGIAYQMCDDTVSIWGTQEQTGKRIYGDILEKKKTMPILHLLEAGTPLATQTLLDLYNSDNEMSHADAEKIVVLLEDVDTYTYMCTEISKKATDAKNAADKLSLTQAQKESLKNIVDQLLPDIKKI